MTLCAYPAICKRFEASITAKALNHLVLMAGWLVILTISAYSGGYVWYICEKITSYACRPANLRLVSP